jgi:starch phosphorylase
VWKKYQAHGFNTKEEFERDVVRHVETTLARSMFNCDETAAYAAASLAFRDKLITQWNGTQQRQTFADPKRVYYLSLEFLMGRTLDNAMLNVGLKDTAKGEFCCCILLMAFGGLIMRRGSPGTRIQNRRYH